MCWPALTQHQPDTKCFLLELVSIKLTLSAYWPALAQHQPDTDCLLANIGPALSQYFNFAGQHWPSIEPTHFAGQHWPSIEPTSHVCWPALVQHLSLMGSLHAHTGHAGINTKDTGPSKVKVIASRSKVTGPKCHTHAHLPLIGSSQAQTGQVGINTLDAGVFIRIPRSRSWWQGQRSQDQNVRPKHIYRSLVAHRHKLVKLVSIPWIPECPIEFQGQGHCAKVKGHRTNISYPCTSTPHW